MAIDARQLIARAMSEEDLQANVKQWAQIRCWRVYHTYDSRRSDVGFPDLVMVREGQVVFAELKAEKGTLEAEQYFWGFDLGGVEDYSRTLKSAVQRDAFAPVRYYLWTPTDWLNGTIEKALL